MSSVDAALHLRLETAIATGCQVVIAPTPKAPELKSSKHFDAARDCMGAARADIVRRGDRRRDLASAS